MTISAKMVSSKPALTVSGPVIECVIATTPASAPLSAKMTVRTNDGLMPTSRAPVSSWITDRTPRPKVVTPKNTSEHRADRECDHRRPDAPHRHRHADDRDRVSADVDVQRAERVAPLEQTLDDERDAERQQEAQQRPLLAVLAVDGPHQRQVERDGDAGRRQRRPTTPRAVGLPSSMTSETTIAAEHGDLAVGEVEHAAEAVDQRHADAEQAERQTEHDPVENDRPHATPRYARWTSGFRSSSSRRPVQPDATVLEHVARSATDRASGTCCSATSIVMPVALEPRERLERHRGDLRRETRRRLVEHQQPRPRHQRAPDRQHLLLAAAQRPRPLALSLLQPREELEHERQRLAVRPPRIRAEREILFTVIAGNRCRSAGTYAIPARAIAVGRTARQILPVEDDPARPSAAAARRWPGTASSCRRRSSR